MDQPIAWYALEFGSTGAASVHVDTTKLPYIEYQSRRYDTPGFTINVTAGANTPRKFRIIDVIGGTTARINLEKLTAERGDIPSIVGSLLGTAAFVEPRGVEGSEAVTVRYSITLNTAEGELFGELLLTLSKEWMARYAVQPEPEPEPEEEPEEEAEEEEEEEEEQPVARTIRRTIRITRFDADPQQIATVSELRGQSPTLVTSLTAVSLQLVGNAPHLVVTNALANGTYRVMMSAGIDSYIINLVVVRARPVVKPPAPTQRLQWTAHQTARVLNVPFANRSNYSLRIPTAQGAGSNRVNINYRLSGNLRGSGRIGNTGVFRVNFTGLSARTQSYQAQLYLQATAANRLPVTTLLTITFKIVAPVASTTNTGEVIRIPDLAWNGGLRDDDTFPINTTRDQLPFQLPKANLTKGVRYSIQSPEDPTLRLDAQRRITTDRPHIYRTPRSFVYSARKGNEAIDLLIKLRIAQTVTLSWVGHEYAQEGEEVTVITRGSSPVAVFRPSGGVPPYRLSLERVGPEGSVVYNAETELLEFPMGLNENDAVTGVMVCTDSENNRAELPFRIISSSTAPIRSFRTTLRTRLGWIDGYGNGSTVTINMRDTNTLTVPLLNRSDVRLTVSDAQNTPGVYSLSGDNKTIEVDPQWLSGVKYRDVLLSAEKDGEITTLVLRLEAGKPFAFLGGHGYNARYVLNGVTDLAAVVAPRTNYFQGDVQYRIDVSDPNAANVLLVEHADNNQLVFGQFSNNVVVTYSASNGTDTVQIVYELRTASTQSPDVPPEGGELRSGVTKTTNTLPVSRATASRAGLRAVMRWSDRCVEVANEIRYTIDPSQSRVFLPEAIVGAGLVQYTLTPLGTTPNAQYEAAGHAAVLPTGPRRLRYRLTAAAGIYFLSKDIRVEVDPGAREPSQDYAVDCDTDDIEKDIFVAPKADTGPGETYHFAGVLTENGTLARVSGTVVHGYKNLTPGAGYGVNRQGELCRITDGTNRALLRAISSTSLIII